MALDLQKVTLRKLLESQNHDFFTKLVPQFFSGTNIILYSKIENFYKAHLKLPSVQEMVMLNKDEAVQEYLEIQILSEDNNVPHIEDNFLVSQLQDYFIREETISFLDKFIDNLEDLEKIEIVDQFQDHLLSMNNAIPTSDELYDVADLEFFPGVQDFRLFPSGLSAEYDAVNGGFATQELVLLGGRRGSGKSIISLNCAIERFMQGNTVAFFTIEMRYKEVHDRLLSIISDVPFLDIYKNRLSATQKIQMAESKCRTFYEKSEFVDNKLKKLKDDLNFKHFEESFKINKPKMLDRRFFIIDDAAISINRIDHYCNMFHTKYNNFTMGVVDYINIVKYEDQKDWKSQIAIAESLKLMSRKYDITMFSPYQIDAGGEARFAKGILDSADRGFNFFPPNPDDDANRIVVHTTKIRNGRAMNFDIGMNWECTKVISTDSQLINEKPLGVAKYGSESENDLKN
jgi:hypothetical protein